jgi:REP element-mobilizing transposase RayT
MVRRPRVEIEGGLYHVYNRVASGEPIFSDPEEVVEFVETLRETKIRDGWTVLAWCVMSNHYHLVVRTSTIPLWRGMHRTQNLFSRRFNKRHGRTGSLWQSRYKARYIDDQAYLGRLLVYVHLNPVSAGVVDNPDEYVFGGHREIKRQSRQAFVDIEEALLCFGTKNKEARRAYLSAIRTGIQEGDDSARLSWHPFRTAKDDADLEVNHALPKVDNLGRSTDLERPTLEAAAYFKAVCELLGVDPAVVASRVRDRETAAHRMMIATLGAERWRQNRTGLARVMNKNPDMVSYWAGEGAKRRMIDPKYAAELDRLDEDLAKKVAKLSEGERLRHTS